MPTVEATYDSPATSQTSIECRLVLTVQQVLTVSERQGSSTSKEMFATRIRSQRSDVTVHV